MSLHIAFKVAQNSFFSQAISKITGGKYSHVELWLSGPQDKALCYSSREPSGTDFATLDLTDPTLWTVLAIPTTPEQDNNLLWYCKGSRGRPYDFQDILGQALKNHHFNIGFARVCSEEVSTVLQNVLNILTQYNPGMISPSGHPADTIRLSLYDLLTKWITDNQPNSVPSLLTLGTSTTIENVISVSLPGSAPVTLGTLTSQGQSS